MTTYSFDGFAIYYNNSVEADTGARFTGISLELVVPQSTKSFSYSVLPLGPDDEAPDDLYVDIALDDYTARLNGDTIGDSNAFNESIFSLSWTDGGGLARNTVIFVAEYLDAIDPDFGLVDPQNIFALAGDVLPSFSSLAEVTSFLDTQVTGLGIPTGTFAPDQAIQLGSLSATVTQNDIITGNGGMNVFFGGNGADIIDGKGGNDTLNGGKGADTLNGGKGDDKLVGKEGKDVLRGDAGNDKLLGGVGKDKLFGGGGKDILNGGEGNDLLVGGGGVDDFVFQDNSGNNVIRDFDATNNKEDINLKAVSNITGFNDLKNNHMTEAGSDVVIDDNAGTVITLMDVALADLGKGDFLF